VESLSPAAGANPLARRAPPDLTGLQHALWQALQQEARHVDALVAAVGTGARVATADVLTALTELELRGVVRQTPGMVFGLV
jgi:predicted Rossmann fold nucleotide-binding protein DprA/Smf involved in DNA uptake